MSGATMIEERANIRRAVLALEICWRCQRVTECRQVVLGEMVATWLCSSCARRAGRDYESARCPQNTLDSRQSRA